MSLCECGCGLPTTVPKHSDVSHGQVGGVPNRFIRGHSSRVLLKRNGAIEFWALVQKGAPGECWLWKGSKQPNGYGRARIYGKTVSAHRVAYQFAFGPIPEGLCVLHRCDNRLCVYYKHLFPGTKAENNTDRHLKGRDAAGERHGSRTRPDTVRKREAHPMAVLTERQVEEIRRLYVPRLYSMDRLARQFGTCRSNIFFIVKGKTWKAAA